MNQRLVSLPSLNQLSREKITITKHGVSVTQLVPVEQIRQRDVQEVIKNLRDFRKRHTLAGLSVRELIDEGR